MKQTASLNVGVLGSGGMAGGELLRWLRLHPNVNDLHAISHTYAGQPLSDVHPAHRHLPPLVFESGDVAQWVEAVDVLFLALPHGMSQKHIKADSLDKRARIIDLAADYRIRDLDLYQAVYGEHADFDLQPHFVYGLPEAFKPEICAARHVANPGCFATAAQLTLLPLAQAKLLPDHAAVTAVTGSTGSGNKPKATTHHPFRDGNYFAYSLLAHRHESEILQLARRFGNDGATLRLLTHSGPFVRGIHATLYAKDARFAELDLAALYRDAYGDDCPFVLVDDTPPQLAAVNGTNFVHLTALQKNDELVVTAVLDNLVKGAAGQAVQNMNLMLGLPETAGLEYPGAFPC